VLCLARIDHQQAQSVHKVVRYAEYQNRPRPIQHKTVILLVLMVNFAGYSMLMVNQVVIVPKSGACYK
jgi:hypothetical protein